MPRRLCEPLCIAFGTSVSSPTAPTYQLYDLPHKLKPRLYMEAREPWRVVREMKGWEQAATAEARSFLHDLLADRSAHDTFYVQLPVPGASNRCRLLQGIVVLTQKHLRIRQTKESCFQLTYQQPSLTHSDEGARGPCERYVYCKRTLTRKELKVSSLCIISISDVHTFQAYLVPRYYASCEEAMKRRRHISLLPACPPGAAMLPKAVCPSDSLRLASPDIKAMEAELRPLAHPGSKCAPHALMMGL